MPLNVELVNSPDLLETTTGDVTRTSSTWETSPAPDDINVATRSNELEEPKVECEPLNDDTEKLKQLEMEQNILPSPRPPIDINVNSQASREDSLTQKNASIQDAATNSTVVNEDVPPCRDSPTPMHASAADSGSALKDATDELDALLLSLTENLMDHTVTP
ncbi:hypothetical protein U0070_007013, partial [Myodes glareolus]